jgi:RNA polymerase sigma factor (sigma-70 family)
MAELSQADRFLLEGIRRGDADAWYQLVDRYRGRLFAFAQSRLRSLPDAEDVVQETFMTFLKALPAFRGEAALETYLFTILRRRLADHFRRRGRRLSVCLLHDVVRPKGAEDAAEPIAQVPAPDPSASWYARRGEQEHHQRQALAEAIRGLLNGYKKALNFRDLKIVEMLFYCQLANKEVAKVSGVGEKHVALIKHRCLKKVRQHVTRHLRSRGVDAAFDEQAPHCEALLTQTWEALRLSCPKRSTIGAFVLGSLDELWQDYVDFHLHRLGCQFCLANLEDLKQQDTQPAASALRDRILESTVGFLRQSYRGPQNNGRR